MRYSDYKRIKRENIVNDVIRMREVKDKSKTLEIPLSIWSKEILNKCLKENKYFKVWSMNWKGPEPMPDDWWQGKVAYYTYKGKS